MLAIRLQRKGKKAQPSYRLIVSEKSKDTQSGSLEFLGYFQPNKKADEIKLDVERVKYWLSVGAQPSTTVNNLLIKAGIITGKKQKSVFISKRRKAKLDANKAKKES